MNLRTRHVRVVAAVGAVLAAGTTTFMALAAGTASADEPGRCTQNVNVREDPDPHAKIVALCEAGKQVKIGEERDGFVRLDELDGWASKDYVKADDAASSEGDSDAHDSADNASADNADSSDNADNSNSGDNHDSSDRATHGVGHPGRTTGASGGNGDPVGGLGGLLG